MKRNVLIVIVVAFLAGFAIYQNVNHKNEETSTKKEVVPKPHFLAPTFSLKALDGKTYVFQGKRDKPIIINFWASWCGPCQLEAPDLQRNFAKYRDKLDLYAVNITQLDTEEDAAAFAKRFNFTFPVLLDPDGKVTGLFKVNSYPTSFFIDKEGMVKNVQFGAMHPKTLEREIQNLLDNK